MNFDIYDDAAIEVWKSKLFTSYDRINDEIFNHCKTYLTRPIFDINPMVNWKWGSWNPSDRILTLSLKLFRNFEWGAVEHVLRHEVAHQIVSEIFNMDCYGVAHGAAWERACAIVNIPAIRCDSAEFLSSFKSSLDDSMTNKVKKLLVHANDQAVTEEEASIFMSKAKELMIRYDIDMKDIDINKRLFVSRPFGLNYKRWPSYLWSLGRMLSNHYNVECIRTYVYIHNVGMTHHLELFGEPSNLDIAEYVGYALLTQAERLYEEAKKEHQEIQRKQKIEDKKNGYYTYTRRFSKPAFMEGLINGYNSRLYQDKKEAMKRVEKEYEEENGVKGIVPTYDSRLLHEMYGKAYPNKRNINIQSSRGEGRSAGNKAGQNLRLAKGVSRSNRQLRLN